MPTVNGASEIDTDGLPAGQFVDPFGMVRYRHNGRLVAAGVPITGRDSVAALAAISRGGNPARAELEECGVIRPRRVKTTEGR